MSDSSSYLGDAVRIVARTPRNIAPVLDAGTSHILKWLLQDTFASAAKKLAPTERLRSYGNEISALLACYFHFVSLVRDSGTVGESLFWIVREELLEKKNLRDKEDNGGASSSHSRSRLLQQRRQGWDLLQPFLTALVHVSGPYLDTKILEIREQFLQMGDLDTAMSPLPELVRTGRWSELFSTYYWKKALVRAYPSYKLSVGIVDVFQRVMFMSGRSAWPTFEHALVEMPVKRLTFREWDAQNKLRSAFRRRRIDSVLRAKPSLRRWLVLNLLKGRFFVEDYNKLFLLAFALCCKGLEWWYSRGEEAAKIPGKALPAPPAPQPHEEGVKLPKSPKLCPICKRMKQSPTVLTVSGYVFCYNCIMLYVKEHKRCPVTFSPATEEQVRKLYFT